MAHFQQTSCKKSDDFYNSLIYSDLDIIQPFFNISAGPLTENNGFSRQTCSNSRQRLKTAQNHLFVYLPFDVSQKNQYLCTPSH